MKSIKIHDSAITDEFSKGLYEEKGYDLAGQHMEKITYVAFVAVAKILNSAKSKERPTTYELKSYSGKLSAVAICQYFPNEDETKPGNWSLTRSFNEEDIPINANRISILTNDESHKVFMLVAGHKYGIKFHDKASIVTLMTYAIDKIYKWLDENATPDEEVCVEQDGVFQARVAVENGEKVFSIEPAGEIKMLIKDDASIEK